MAQPRSQADWDALHYEASLLFSPSAPVDEAALFAGRQPQILKLIETVLERGKHAVLYGERGVGKTSLVKVLRLLFPTIVNKVVLIREQLHSDDTFTAIWWKAFRDIEAEKRDRFIMEDVYERDLTPDDVRRELSRAFVASDIPVVVLDEFDRTSAEIRRQKTPSM
jgi:MoxR-like ATPase